MSRLAGATPENSRTAPRHSAVWLRGLPFRRRGLRRRSGPLLRLLASLPSLFRRILLLNQVLSSLIREMVLLLSLNFQSLLHCDL